MRRKFYTNNKRSCRAMNRNINMHTGEDSNYTKIRPARVETCPNVSNILPPSVNLSITLMFVGIKLLFSTFYSKMTTFGGLHLHITENTLLDFLLILKAIDYLKACRTKLHPVTEMNWFFAGFLSCAFSV